MAKKRPGPGAGTNGARRRVVVAGGVRTPFTRAFRELASLDTIALAKAACGGLLERTGIDPREIDEVFWGSVIFKTQAPNTAREVVFELNLPRSIPGVTVTRACLSGLQAITSAAQSIERGDLDVCVAGGSDSVSNAEMPFPPALVQALGKIGMSGKLTAKKVWDAIAGIGSARNIIPRAPKVAERATGRTMGEHADDMARANGITREAQDAFAIRSHRRAAAAQASGRFGDEVCPVEGGPGGGVVDRDTLIREDPDPGKIARLPPVFRKDGTITAASSSPLTDGGSAVLLMSEEKARALGLPADVALVDWRYTALDPFDQLLIGPALAVPPLARKHGLTIDDIDLFEVHEAFAAQVLSLLQALASETFAKERLGDGGAFGEVPDEKLNPHGGSVAIGHPFAATGGRLVTTAANELRLTGKRRAIVTLCAAGAMGGAALLERIDA